MKKINLILTGKLSLKNDVLQYMIGNYRYKLYYWIVNGISARIDKGKYSFNYIIGLALLRFHIYEQISWRIRVMDRECYTNGSCLMCGCSTTALQCANKSCDKPCYPEMMTKYHWKRFIAGKSIVDKHGIWNLDLQEIPHLYPYTKAKDYVSKQID